MNANNPQLEIVWDIARPDFKEPTHRANQIFVGSLIYRQDKIRVAYVPSRSRDFYLFFQVDIASPVMITDIITLPMKNTPMGTKTLGHIQPITPPLPERTLAYC
jgi:hypothetical protein